MAADLFASRIEETCRLAQSALGAKAASGPVAPAPGVRASARATPSRPRLQGIVVSVGILAYFFAALRLHSDHPDGRSFGRPTSHEHWGNDRKHAARRATAGRFPDAV